jgi:hypothetical protein
MTNDEGMTKVNSRTPSESNDERFLQRVPHTFGIRHLSFVISVGETP